MLANRHASKNVSASENSRSVFPTNLSRFRALGETCVKPTNIGLFYPQKAHGNPELAWNSDLVVFF